jgi:hypothetical protein
MLFIYYKLKCDMCGVVKDLGVRGSDKNVWQHELPVRGVNDIHYELMDLCPSCIEKLALRPVKEGKETRYVRKEDEC